MSTDPRRDDTAKLDRSPEAHLAAQLAAARRHIEECEAALEESEARFRNIIDNNGDAIVVVGNDGIVRYANAAAGRMFGRASDQLQGTPFGFPLSAGETTEVDIVADGGVIRPAEMRVADSV